MGAMVEWDPVVKKVFLIDLFRSANQSEVSGGVGGRGVSATRVMVPFAKSHFPNPGILDIFGHKQSQMKNQKSRIKYCPHSFLFHFHGSKTVKQNWEMKQNWVIGVSWLFSIIQGLKIKILKNKLVFLLKNVTAQPKDN